MLIALDIHFQYNGMLLGVLILAMTFILEVQPVEQQYQLMQIGEIPVCSIYICYFAESKTFVLSSGACIFCHYSAQVLLYR